MSSKEKENFSNYLSQEISRIESETRRPGWTGWAIFAAFGTLGWLILNIVAESPVEISKINIKILTTAIFLLAISCEVIFLFFELVITQQKADSTDAFRSTYNLFRPSIYSLLLVLTVSLVIVVNLFSLDIPITDLEKFATVADSSLIFLYCLFMIVIYLYRLPFPSNVGPLIKNSIASVILTTLYTFISISSFWTFVSIIQSNVDFGINEIKLASLISAEMFLIILFFQSLKSHPVIDSLIEIRRSLALDETSLDDAKKRSKVAFLGLTISEIFMGKLEVINAWIELYSETTDAWEKEIDNLTIPKAPTIDKVEELGKNLVKFNKKTNEDKKKLDAEQERTTKKLKRITKQIEIIVKLGLLTQRDGSLLGDYLSERLEDLETEHKKILQTLENYKQKLTKLFDIMS